MPDRELKDLTRKVDLLYAMMVALCDVLLTEDQLKMLSNELALVRAGRI